jgi:glucosylceramidase
VTTSSDGAEPMRTLDIEARSSSNGDLDISVDHGLEEQRIEAFGAAMTHSSAALLNGMPHDQRTELLEELFAPDGTVRLSTLRLPLGASDFVDTDAFTFDDLPAGENSTGSASSPIAEP